MSDVRIIVRVNDKVAIDTTAWSMLRGRKNSASPYYPFVYDEGGVLTVELQHDGVIYLAHAGEGAR